MDVILIRHGAENNSKKLQDNTPLSLEGEKQVRRLKDSLECLQLRPEVFLKSPGYERVDETAKILSDEKRVVSIEALGPLDKTGFAIENILEEIITQAQRENVDLNQHNITVALIGHGPMLNLLLTRLISQRVRPLGCAEAVWVRADCLLDFRCGKGQIECRIPITDYQEGELRSKVQSKMTVSTFLAGFVFTVLANLLMVSGASFTPWQIGAIWFLTAAAALFIVAVYIYDQLAMPEGFLLYDSNRRRQSLFWRILEHLRGKRFKDDLRERGSLYAYMVWTWSRIFTFGVFCGIIGFILMLLNTGRRELIAGGGIVVLVAALAYWFFARPPQSID